VFQYSVDSDSRLPKFILLTITGSDKLAFAMPFEILKVLSWCYDADVTPLIIKRVAVFVVSPSFVASQ
jgi:hypothetical protein